jgi:hypothetical protein
LFGDEIEIPKESKTVLGAGKNKKKFTRFKEGNEES